MEIKRRFNEAAKRLTPQIEASNTGAELRRIAERVHELLTYAEAKEVRRQESVATGMSFAQRTQARIQGDIQKGRDIQEADELEHMQDQQQHDAQPDVDFPPVDLRTDDERIADEEAEASREEIESTPIKKKAKKRAGRKSTKAK
jgi:hypothetical protein